MIGQAYVQRRSPETVRHRLPIVMIPGGHQTIVNFETTPDMRPGWSNYFVTAGFAVYLMDQPGLGRSPYLEPVYGSYDPAFTTERVEERFTAPGVYGLWPQAESHTQWPGTGRAGDPVFDHFYASQVPGIKDPRLREELIRAAGAALLDRIGPAIVLTHSQSGAFGWQIGDARPDLVKGIVAVEPGRVFVDANPVGPPGWWVDSEVTRPWGLTYTPIAYDPPVIDPATDLPYVRPDEPEDPLVCRTYLQREPARRLANLSKVRAVVVTGEASWHRGYDRGTVEYLRQGGMEVDHIELAEIGIHGNGHMMMLERNSDEIAAVIERWLVEHDLG